MSISNIDKIRKKLEKIKKLADNMYYAAANLGPNIGSGERLRKTMEEYHKFIIHEYHKEKPVSEDFETALEKKVREAQDWTYIEEEGGECPLYEEFGADDLEEFARWGADWVRNNEKEPVSEDLEEAIDRYEDLVHGFESLNYHDCRQIARYFAKWGSDWQKEHFEKNRLKHCNSITEEQYNLEVGFIDQHLDKYNRMPGYLDAIEYGMNLQKKQVMKEAVDGIVEYKYSRSGKDLFNVSSLKLLDAANFNLNNGEKVKLLIIKEE